MSRHTGFRVPSSPSPQLPKSQVPWSRWSPQVPSPKVLHQQPGPHSLILPHRVNSPKSQVSAVSQVPHRPSADRSCGSSALEAYWLQLRAASSPKSQVPSPKSQVPSPKSQVPSPKLKLICSSSQQGVREVNLYVKFYRFAAAPTCTLNSTAAPSSHSGFGMLNCDPINTCNQKKYS